MAKILLVIIAFAAIVCAEEDVEQKKRGAGKTTSLNSIPTGVQKPDYTYNIYSQNPSGGQSSSPSSYQSSQAAYQAQIPNSFYPSQSNQYYTSDTPTDSSYPQQPQINLIPPTTPSQFVPLNFVPSSGYQAKYQIVPSKNSQGNLQLAIVPQPSSYPSPVLQYQNPLIPSASQIPHQQSPFGGIPNGYFNVAPNFQPFALGGGQIGQPSTMVLVPQANPSLYNNLLYPNPVQSFYNYYPTNSQAKYSVSYGSSQSPEGSQSAPKDGSDVQNLDYASSDQSYKSAFAPSRSASYAKLK